MKRIAFAVLTIVCCHLVSNAQYFETTRRNIPTPPDQITMHPCNPAVARSLVFGFEQLRQGTQSLDIAAGKSIWLPPPFDPLEYLFTFSYNMNGEFPSYDFFWQGTALCHAPIFLKRFVFGKLRPSVSPARRDFVIIMSRNAPFIWRTELFHNQLNIAPDPVQDISGNAVDGSWGAFTSNDDLEDLAVTDPDNTNGPQIRIYRNQGNGFLDDVLLFTFTGGDEYKAQQIILAQIDKPADFPVLQNKLDLVGIDVTKIKIWRNDNSNGLPTTPPQKQEIDLQIGSITSLGVADINNDGYNDIIVGTMLGARLFLNSANTNGDIQTTAYWGTSNPTKKHLIAIGDIGSPGVGGESRTDGWNDLVVASANADGIVTFSIFINQQGVQGVYFTPTPQEVRLNAPPGGKGSEAPCNPDEPLSLQLADVKTNGGLSIAYTVKCDDGKIFLFS